MFKKKEKVAVAMSGGVDSSVAAALLLDKGYDVTGVFMINYSNNGDMSACWENDYKEALRAAAKLGIPLLKLNFTKEYKKFVLNYLFNEYEAGLTPNPDVFCNKFVKFGAWLRKIKELGFDKLATGHYAKINRIKKVGRRPPNDKFSLLIPKNKRKDQTYFLHQIGQKQLSSILFPIGDYTKDEVRGLAKKYKLPNAEREESMGICFIGEVPIKKFLQTRIKPKPGNIILSDYARFPGVSRVIGRHEGLPFYTIGQRHGLGFINKNGKFKDKIGGFGKPLYVVDKRFNSNELVVGYKNDPVLFKKEVLARDTHWISGLKPNFPLKCKVRVRHGQALHWAELRIKNGAILVIFKKAQRAVAPGQFIVFYLNNECLGGGVIV